jgi:hypothetical protein
LWYSGNPHIAPVLMKALLEYALIQSVILLVSIYHIGHHGCVSVLYSNDYLFLSADIIVSSL